jgi:flagellin-like protein
MNRRLIIAGFIVLIIGGLLYTLVPYTSTSHYEMQTDGTANTKYTTSTTTTGNSPLGTVVMFIGFTIVVVGLFYKPQKAEPPKIEQENP